MLHLSFSFSFSDTFSHSSSVLTLLLVPCDGELSPAATRCFSSPCFWTTSSSLLADAAFKVLSSPPPTTVTPALARPLLMPTFGLPSTSVSLSSLLIVGVCSARRAFSSSCCWCILSSRANQLIAHQRPPDIADNTTKCMLCVAKRSRARTSWRAAKVTFVAIRSVGVGPGVNIDSQSSDTNVAMAEVRCEALRRAVLVYVEGVECRLTSSR